MTMRENDAALKERMTEGKAARQQALAAYLRALPIDTKDHWELFRVMLLDFAMLRDELFQKGEG